MGNPLSFFQVATLVLAIITTLLLPLVVFLVRGAVKWTRVEGKLDNVIEELKKIVVDKDKVHAEMFEKMREDKTAADRVHTEIFTQMREDRAATDKRLRWLEEYLWKLKNGVA